jgi:hypothetical protein
VQILIPEAIIKTLGSTGLFAPSERVHQRAVLRGVPRICGANGRGVDYHDRSDTDARHRSDGGAVDLLWQLRKRT